MTNNSLDLFKKGLGDKNSPGEKQPDSGSSDLNLTTVSPKNPPAKKAESTAQAGSLDARPVMPTVQSAFTIREDLPPSDQPKKPEGSWIAQFTGGAKDEGVATAKALFEIVAGKPDDIETRLRNAKVGGAKKADILANVGHSGSEIAGSVKLLGGAGLAKTGLVQDTPEYKSIREAAGQFKDKLLSGDADAMGHATVFVGSLFVGGGGVAKGSRAGSSMRELQLAAKGWKEISAADAALTSARALRTSTTSVADDLAKVTARVGETGIPKTLVTGAEGLAVATGAGGESAITKITTARNMVSTTLGLADGGAPKLATTVEQLGIAGGGTIEKGTVKLGGQFAVTGLADDVMKARVAGAVKEGDVVAPIVVNAGEHVVTPGGKVAANVGEHAVTPGGRTVVNVGDNTVPVVKAGEHAAPVVKGGEQASVVGGGAKGDVIVGATDAVVAPGATRVVGMNAPSTAFVHVETAAQEVAVNAGKLADNVTGPNARLIKDDLAKFADAVKIAGRGGEEALQAGKTIEETLARIKSAGGESIVRELEGSLTRFKAQVEPLKAVQSAAVNLETTAKTAGQKAAALADNVTGPNAQQIKDDISRFVDATKIAGRGGEEAAQATTAAKESLARIKAAGGESIVRELQGPAAKLEQALADTRQAIKVADQTAAHQTIIASVEREATAISSKIEAAAAKVTGPNAASIKQDLGAVSKVLSEMGTAGGDDVKRLAAIEERLAAIEKAGGKALVEELRPAIGKLDETVAHAQPFKALQGATQHLEAAASDFGRRATALKDNVTGPQANVIKEELAKSIEAAKIAGKGGDEAVTATRELNESLSRIKQAGGENIVRELQEPAARLEQIAADTRKAVNVADQTAIRHSLIAQAEREALDLSNKLEAQIAKVTGPNAAQIQQDLNVASKTLTEMATNSGDNVERMATVQQRLAAIEKAGGKSLIEDLKPAIGKLDESVSGAQPFKSLQNATTRVETAAQDVATNATKLMDTVQGPQASLIRNELTNISEKSKIAATKTGDEATQAAESVRQSLAKVEGAGGADLVRELKQSVAKFNQAVSDAGSARTKVNEVVARVARPQSLDDAARVAQPQIVADVAKSATQQAVTRLEQHSTDIASKAEALAKTVTGPNARQIQDDLNAIAKNARELGTKGDDPARLATIEQKAAAIEKAEGGAAIMNQLRPVIGKIDDTVANVQHLRNAETLAAKPLSLSDEMVRAQQQAFARVETGAQTLDAKATALAENVTGRNAAKLQEDLSFVSKTAREIGTKTGDDTQRIASLKERIAQMEQTAGGASLAREIRPMLNQLDDAVAKAQPFKALEGSAARVEVASNNVGNTALRIADKVDGPNAQLIRDELQKINTAARTENSVAKIQESMAKIESHGGGALLDDLRGPVAKLDTAVQDANRVKSLTNATVKVETQSAEISQKISQLGTKLDGPNARVIEDQLTQMQKTAVRISEGTIDESQGINRLQQHIAVIESKGGGALVSDLKPMVSNLDRSVIEAQGLRSTVTQASKVEAISTNVAGEARRIASTLGDDAKSLSTKQKLTQIEESSIRAVQAGESPQAQIANINKNIAAIEAQGGGAAVKELRSMVNQLEAAQTYRTLEQSMTKVETHAGTIGRETRDLAARIDTSTQAGMLVKDHLQAMSRTADDIIAQGDKSGALVKSLNQNLAIIEAQGGSEIAAGLRRSMTDLNEAVGTSKQAATDLFNYHSSRVDSGFATLRSQGHMASQADLVADMRAHLQMMRYLAPTDGALLSDLSKAEYHLSRVQSVANILSVSPEVARASSKQLAGMRLGDLSDLAAQKQLIVGLQSDSWLLLRQMARPQQFVQTMVVGLSKEPMLVLKTGLGFLAPEANAVAAATWGLGGTILAADAARAYTLYRSYQQRDAELSVKHIEEYNAKVTAGGAQAEVRSDDPRYQAVPKNRQDELRLSPATEAIMRPSGVLPTTSQAEINGISANNPNARMFNDNLITKGRIWGTWGLQAAPAVIADESRPAVPTHVAHRTRSSNAQNPETPTDKREKTSFSYFTVTQRAMDINTPSSLMASLGHSGRRDARGPQISSIAPFGVGGSRTPQVDLRNVSHYSGLAEGRNAPDYRHLQDVEETETGLDRPGSGIASGANTGGRSGPQMVASNQAQATDPNNQPNNQTAQILSQSAQSTAQQNTQDEENNTPPQVTV